MAVRLAACAALLFALLAVPLADAGAQDVDRIAAVVNDEAISLRDVEARVRIALLFSNMPDTPETRRRIAPHVIRKMIDERLQMQEAARLKITLSPAELDNGITMLEQQNRLPKGALLGRLQQMGIDPVPLREQIKADLTWLRVTGRVLQSQVRVGDEEINDRLEIIKARQGRPEYLAAEIFLPVDRPDQEDEVRRLGENLVEQLRAGANFGALARQFSRAPTAANNGSMGWVTDDGIDEELRAILAPLGKGQVSPLTRTSSGFHILAVLDQRIAGAAANPEDARVTIGQITLPVPPKAPPKAQLMAQAAELVGPARSCDDLEAIGRRVGAAVAPRVGPVRTGELQGPLRRLALGSPVGRAAPPLDIPDGIGVAMVCSREDSTQVTMPSREQVRRMIEDERLDMLARRYLRDLRRAAFVDLRI